MNEAPHDVEALLTLLGTAEGGRSLPAVSDWRPMVFYDSEFWIVLINFPDVPRVNPGEQARAFLDFFSPDVHVNKLSVGTTFRIHEGRAPVAHGTITKILNLEESAQRVRASGMPSNNRWRGP
jgi:translation elongation factor EF-Tu-like GTPase